MLNVIVFIGPTIRPEDADRELDALYVPPVAQGDVYKAALQKPRAMGIVDGYFEAVPAVWHKEILWAMSQGIHVFGSASMGALRAAELAPFGMIGVGWIFDAYRRGELEDDDEVAVTHGPAETSFVPLSEAMVNIRRTLRRAETTGIVSAGTAARLTGIAKGLFYKKRCYSLVIERASQIGVSKAELLALRSWLPQGKVDQKGEDAREMLRLIGRWLACDPAPNEVRFTFQHTDMWDEAMCAAHDEA
jgi:hypothetical protein